MIRPIAIGTSTVVLLLLFACASSCSSGPGATCNPEPLQLSSAEVAAGQTVVVSSGAFRCQRSYPPGKKYHLVLALQGRANPMDLGTYPVAMNGRFTATVRIPYAAPPGSAYVTIRGSPLDTCSDREGGASCAGYAVRLTIRPSNVTPPMP